jgi:hypothetical protein
MGFYSERPVYSDVFILGVVDWFGGTNSFGSLNYDSKFKKSMVFKQRNNANKR